MRLRRWFLQDDEHLIRIISWMPIITRDEILGPLLLVRRGGRVQRIRSIWDMPHLRAPWRKDHEKDH